MSLQFAVNDRTQIKASIKRASARARVEMNALDAESLDVLHQIYSRAVDQIKNDLALYADDENNLRIESLHDIEQQIERILQSLSQARNDLLHESIGQAAVLGTAPYQGVAEALTLMRVADDAVRFSQRFIANDGLQLSDRLWRLDRGARQSVMGTIQTAIAQGWGPSQAASDFLGRGMLGKVSDDVDHVMLTGVGSARYNALRVMRTELNRAHGEAYMAGGEGVEDFAGWRFLLSPRHPEPDVCDMHARVNRYGLGAGVYPSRAKCPWPAHPNTLSYVEIVFTDEITDIDRLGQLNRIQWLKTQSTGVQHAVLRSDAKVNALSHDLLRENEINTPWHALRKKYQNKGINIAPLELPPPPPVKLGGTRIFGIDPAELQAYIDEAWRTASPQQLALIHATPPLRAVQVVPSGSSYYTPSAQTMTLSRKSMLPRSWAPDIHDVYRHEYGHHVDLHGGKQLSVMPNSVGGLGDSMRAARRSLYARTNDQRMRVQQIRNDLYRLQDIWLSDVFGALTYGKIGGGHTSTYYRKSHNAETEVFANLFTMYARNDRTSWRYVQQELPDLAQAFDDYMRRFL